MTPTDDDFFDLQPVRETRLPQTRGRAPLTEHQRDIIVQAQADVAREIAGGASECVKLLLEIHKIRQASEGQVAVIEAQTESLRERFRGEVQKMREERARLGDQGDITVNIIRELRAMMRDIPDGDVGSRAALIAQVPSLVESALRLRDGAPKE